MIEPGRISITHSSSIIGFDSPSKTKAGPQWDRYLTIEGKRAYHIGNICGTCQFFFERLEGADQSVSPTGIAERLNTGNDIADPEFTDVLSQILPIGSYFVSFQFVLPRLTSPGEPNDYFAKEQAESWGNEAFPSPPHDPHTSYYRSRSLPLAEQSQLFEFIVPITPFTALEEQRVMHYKDEIARGVQPTAFAISVLDVKQPADWDGDPRITEHWCLAHYLLDGHHKMHAAAQQNAPLNLISFLAVDESLASEEQIKSALATLV